MRQSRDSFERILDTRLARMPHASYTGIMPRFTRENAAEMSKRGNMARWTRAKLPAESRAIAPEIPEDERKKRVMEQIDKVDSMLSRTRNPVLFVKLTLAKEKLWNLVFPKPGSLKPSRAKDQRRAPIAPQPLEPITPLVVPDPQENHNGEIIQSQVTG